MMENGPKAELQHAFAEMFAMNVFDFCDGYRAGGPDYYGVTLEVVDTDGAEVDLTLIFRSGERYCCFEIVCHFPHYAERSWARLRACMNRQGLSHLPLPVVRRLQAVIERGAVANPSPKAAVSVMEGSAFEVGPLLPIVEIRQV